MSKANLVFANCGSWVAQSKFGFYENINIRQNGKMSKPNLLD